ncbi:MAG: hypothetical protein LBS89_03300 [Zoogloeaceae bacterium]|jgi:phage-related protein|nr:hypothetical protein [Zoogloeaceae bacterium]
MYKIQKTPMAHKEAGYPLGQVQRGLDSDEWKPFDIVGAGTKEIRIDLNDGWFRVMYIAKFPEAVVFPSPLRGEGAPNGRRGESGSN